MMKNTVRIVCALAIVAALGCGSGRHYTAGDVARDYYGRIQRGEFDSAMELWDAERAARAKKGGLPWPQVLARMQRDLGPLESFERFTQEDTQSGSGDRILNLAYQVQYERGRATERLVVRIPMHSEKSMAIMDHSIRNNAS